LYRSAQAHGTVSIKPIARVSATVRPPITRVSLFDPNVRLAGPHGWKTPFRAWAVNACLTVVALELMVLKKYPSEFSADHTILALAIAPMIGADPSRRIEFSLVK
jgi:hypothetical protein